MKKTEKLATALLTQSQSDGRNCLELHKDGTLISTPLKKGKKSNIAGGKTSANALIEYLKKNEVNLHKLAKTYQQENKHEELAAIQKIINEVFVKKRKLKKAPDLFLYINENWMRDLPSAAKKRKMNEFVLPGTHDSGAYQVKLTKTPKGEGKFRLDIIAKLISIGKIFGAKKLVKELTITQHYNFKDQLNLGARYFDLRVCYNPSDKKYYLSHTFACAPLTEALRDIAEFMKSHPNEMIVLQIQPDGPHANELNKHKDGFYELLHQYLGDLTVKHDGQRKRHIDEFGQQHYDELIKKNQRVALGIRQINAPDNKDYLKSIWNSNLNNEGWLNKPSVSSGLKKLEDKINTSTEKPDKMHCIATSLTPKDKEYVKRGVRKYLPFLKINKDNAKEKLTTSIINLSREMNEHIPDKIHSNYHGIVYCDSPDHSGAFNHLINLNRDEKTSKKNLK